MPRIFSSSRSGMLYRVTTYLALGDDARGFNFRLPCDLRISGRRKIVIHEVDGLPDTVKQDMGESGFEINVSTHFGDYDPPQISAKLPLVATEHLTDLKNFYSSVTGPVKAADEQGLLTSLGISHVVFANLDIDKGERPGTFLASMRFYSEMMPDTGALELLSTEEPT